MVEKTKHTPGPWRVAVDNKGDVAVEANDYGVICYPLEDNYQDNARLIAAAPEMYALLEATDIALTNVLQVFGLKELSDEARAKVITSRNRIRALTARIDTEE